MPNPNRPQYKDTIASTWGQAVADTVVRRYGTAAERDADLSTFTPAELKGQVVTIGGSLEVHDGTEWAAVVPGFIGGVFPHGPHANGASGGLGTLANFTLDRPAIVRALFRETWSIPSNVVAQAYTLALLIDGTLIDQVSLEATSGPCARDVGDHAGDGRDSTRPRGPCPYGVRHGRRRRARGVPDQLLLRGDRGRRLPGGIAARQ